MHNAGKTLLTALSLALVSAWASAVTTGPLTGDTAAQAPMGPSAQSRFATDLLDDSVLGSFASGSLAQLFATGSTLELRYLGTGAARDASLWFAGTELFQTRSGCDFATALADEFCLIGTIGQARSISGLTPGSLLQFDLNAQAQTLGGAADQRASAQSFSSLSAAHVVDLGDGRLLLGFEEGSDGSYNDMVFLVSGASLTAPVPEPGALPLLGAGLLALFLRRQRRR